MEQYKKSDLKRVLDVVSRRRFIRTWLNRYDSDEHNAELLKRADALYAYLDWEEEIPDRATFRTAELIFIDRTAARMALECIECELYQRAYDAYMRHMIEDAKKADNKDERIQLGFEYTYTHEPCLDAVRELVFKMHRQKEQDNDLSMDWFNDHIGKL